MSIIGILVIILYIILVPAQILIRLIILVIEKKSLYHIKFSAFEFFGFALIYILAFQNFDGYNFEKHILTKSQSLIILTTGYLSYFINSLLVEQKPKRIEVLLLFSMYLTIVYCIFSIWELVTQNEFSILKLILLQLPFLLLMIIGIIIYSYRPCEKSENDNLYFKL